MYFDATLDLVVRSVETRDNIIGDGKLACTYREIADHLDQIDRSLVRQGIGPDSCVAVECANSLAGALLLLALLRKGRSFVLTPPALGGLDSKPTPRFCDYRLTITGAGPDHIQSSPNPPYNGKRANGARLYLRTSGSMGISKIVVHAHDKLLDNARNCVAKYKFNPASRVTIPVPIAHMYGFGAEFLPAVMTGAAIDLQEKTNVLKYLERERLFQPTIVFGTPSICEMLLKGYKAPRTCYEVFVTSGQRIGGDLFRAFDPYVGGCLIDQYGSTEMGATAACDRTDALNVRASSIGRPMPGVELKVDPSGTNELSCRHPYGFEGYVDEDGEWLQQASEDGWYRTGDVVETRPDGWLSVIGRTDASVNRRGYLVLLSDIERLMERLDALSTVVVVAGSGEGAGGRHIAAFCVPRDGAVVNAGEIRSRCFDLLPHYAIPDEVHVREALPTLPTGKVDRRTLAAMIG